MSARGIRNNNPGNIRKGEKWKGLSEHQTDSSFCIFVSPEYGIRALVKILLTYYKKYKLNTVKKIISRYAPPSENETESYIKSVANQLGVASDEEIYLSSVAVLAVLLRAIIRHENGEQPYSDEQILKGIHLAGVK